MRRSALPAVLIALACVSVADACFLKKLCCWGGGGEPAYSPVPVPEPGPAVTPVPSQGSGATVKIPATMTNPVIVSVASPMQAPAMGNIPNPIDSTGLVVITVHTTFDPGMSSTLTVEDLGFATTDKGKGKDKDNDSEKGPPTPAAFAKKTYHPARVIKKERPKAEAAPAPGAVMPMLGGTVYWEAQYEVPSSDLQKGHRYRAVATAGGLNSDPVTFTTKP